MSEQRASTTCHGAALLILGGCALFLLVVRILLISERFLPIHDTFQRFCLQYAYLWNEPALHHGIPQWDPFLCHGTANYWYFIISLNMFSAVCALVAPILKGINCLLLCNLGLWFEECALLLGCFLVARRWYASLATVAFVTAAVALTAVSSSQFHFNLRLIYLVPLVIYCGDCVVRDGSFRHMVCGGILCVGMMVLNFAYAAPLLAFALMVFTASLAACAGRRAVQACRACAGSLTWRHGAVVLGTGFLLAIAWCYMNDCLRGMHVFTRDDPRSANISFAVFMRYGGSIAPSKYLELIWRYSNNGDLAIYAGILLVPFFCVALLRVRTPLARACVITGLVLVLFTSGTWVSAAFYHFFPLGKMYRHIGLAAPLAKLFLVWYAGFGFDAFWLHLHDRATCARPSLNVRDRLPAFIPLAAMALVVAMVLVQKIGWCTWYHYSSTWPEKGFALGEIYQTADTMALVNTRVASLAIAYLVLIAAVIVVGRFARVAAVMLLLIHCADTMVYKIEQETIPAPKASHEEIRLFDACSYDYPPTRIATPWACTQGAFFSNSMTRSGVQYCSMATLTRCDMVGSVFEAQLCEEPVYQFFRVWSSNAPGREFFKCFSPPASSAFGKACGRDLPKLQLFSRAHAVGNDEEAAAAFRRTGWTGDILLVADSMHERRAALSDTACERLTNATMQVRAFSYDRLSLDVLNPASSTAVLYYADAWHPFWRATVNGTAISVMRANIAYKAVEVPPGKSHVVFAFGTPWSTFLLYGIIGIALLSFGAVVYLCAVDAIGTTMPRRRSLVLIAAAILLGAAVCASVAASATVRACLLGLSLTAPMDRVIAQCSARLATSPDDTAALVARGDFYCRRGNIDLAIADYEAVTALDSNCAPAYIGLCDAYVLLYHDWKESRSYWLVSRYLAAAFRCATGGVMMSSMDRAVLDDEIGALVEKTYGGPQDPDVYHRLSLLRLRAGDVTTAAEDHSRMLTLLPPPPGAHGYYQHGITRMALGLYPQALADFGEALRLMPGSPLYRAQFDLAYVALTNACATVGGSAPSGTLTNDAQARRR